MKQQHQARVEGRASSTGRAKRYEPVKEFERQTSYCPLYLAWRIVDEARDYFRTSIPETFADKLAHRAEAVFAHQPFWARKVAAHAGARQQFECRRQREYILMSMRHWLAGVLARERPALFCALPERFKIGMVLPEYHGRARSPLRAEGKANLARRARSDAPYRHFVHGCEILAV
jgi:hypothetical protein